MKLSMAHTGKVCSFKGCGKPTYIDYFVCQEHWVEFVKNELVEKAGFKKHVPEEKNATDTNNR